MPALPNSFPCLSGSSQHQGALKRPYVQAQTALPSLLQGLASPTLQSCSCPQPIDLKGSFCLANELEAREKERERRRAGGREKYLRVLDSPISVPKVRGQDSKSNFRSGRQLSEDLPETVPRTYKESLTPSQPSPPPQAAELVLSRVPLTPSLPQNPQREKSRVSCLDLVTGAASG